MPGLLCIAAGGLIAPLGPPPVMHNQSTMASRLEMGADRGGTATVESLSAIKRDGGGSQGGWPPLMHDCMQTNVLVLQQPSVLALPTAQCASAANSPVC